MDMPKSQSLVDANKIKKASDTPEQPVMGGHQNVNTVAPVGGLPAPGAAVDQHGFVAAKPAKAPLDRQDQKVVETVILRTKSSHPDRRFQLGRHSVGPQFESFGLNESEKEELEGEGPKAWLEIGDKKKMHEDAKLHEGIDADSKEL